MAQTVVGIFKSASEAQNAVDNLLSGGFSQGDIDVSSGQTSNYSTQDTTENESGIGRFFRNLFGDNDNERERYTRAAERGTVVTVHAQGEDEAKRASLLLDQYGAMDVNDDDGNYDYSTGTGRGNLEGTNSDYSTGTDRAYSNEDENKTIPVIEENLQVGKREVQTGGVRLRSRIIEKPVEENLRLREEHVRVERNTVDRPATEADFNDFKEGNIEVTEHAEVPVVSKEARVVEEVSLGKEVEHREETVRDSVRKTEVDVEDIEADTKGRKRK